MAKKIVRDISFSTVQVILNQLFGLLIFYITSRYLDKKAFGELNWSIATASLIVSVLTFGLDVIIVRRIAAGGNVKRLGGLHLLHTLAGSVLFICLLLISRYSFPEFFNTHPLLTGISISAILTFISSPYKQIANGREAFGSFAIMSVTGNVMKGCLLVPLVWAGIISPRTVVSIFIIASFTEWIIGFTLTYLQTRTSILPYWNKRQYRSLIGESLPQLGVIVFDSALARIDWILLGIIAGSVATAEYSFAYKIFEISRLPMLVLAPVILPKFIQYLGSGNRLGPDRKQHLSLLLRIETVVALLIPIFFNITWAPLMSWLTQGKYGTVNESVYLLISLAVPLHFFTNFLWTMALAQKQIRLTFYITIAISLLNILLNILLIPKYTAMGAASAFTASTVLQLILYKRYVNQEKLNVPLLPLVKSIGIAAVTTILAKRFIPQAALAAVAGISAYLLLALLSGIMQWKDIRNIKLILK